MFSLEDTIRKLHSRQSVGKLTDRQYDRMVEWTNSDNNDIQLGLELLKVIESPSSSEFYLENQKRRRSPTLPGNDE